MRHTTMKLASIALAALALGVEASTVIGWNGAVTEGYWDDTSNWGTFDPGNIDNWFRVDVGNKTVPYVITVTNRQEITGLFQIILSGSVPYGVTLDVSNGVFKQIDGDGSAATFTGDPFNVMTDDYSPNAFYVSASDKKHNMLLFSNTVVKATKTLDGTDSTVDISFTGGYVSFAEPNASNAGTILQSGTSDSGDVARNYLFDHVTTVLPQFIPRGGTVSGTVWFKGGECDMIGEFAPFQSAHASSGKSWLKFTDGAVVTIRSNSNFILGYNNSPHRTNIVDVAGAGTKLSHSGVKGIYLRGISVFNVHDGAEWELPRSPTATRYVYFGQNAGAEAHVTVSGAGSVINAIDVVSFNVLNRSSITVADGGTFILPKGSAGFSLGSNDAADNDVTMTVTGSGSRIICPNGSSLYVGDRIATSTRATLNVADGGYVGTTNETESYGFVLGNKAGTVGILNLSGGEVRGGKGNALWVGASGSGELNVSGGVLRVSNAMYVGGYSSASGATSSFRQTGGEVHVGSSVAVCANSNGGATDDRVCDMFLEGGVLEASNIYGGGGVSVGGTARVKADGGTLKAIETRTGAYPFIYSLSSFTVGAKGFTIDTAGFDELVTQSMGDVAGEKGTLRKVGEGALIYEAGTYSVATTVVAQGSLAFRGAAPAFTTALTVTNGATLSLAGTPSALALDALTLDGATLSLDPGDCITVAGPATIHDLTLDMTSAPETNAANPIIVCNGEIDAESVAALRRAYCAVAHTEGYHGSFRAVYDAETGKTTISYESVPNGEPLSGDDVTVYSGDDGVWSTAGNWSNGLPDETKKASFTDASAAKNITVPAGALVGALAFGADGVTLSGGSIEVAAEEGSAEIEVSAGSATVETPLALDAHKVCVPVAAGAEIDLAGGVSGGGLVKSGSGHLTISGAGSFLFPPTFGGGITTLAHSNALDGAKSLSLTGGTLETTAAGTSLPVTTAGEDASSVQIFKTEADTTVKAGEIKGAFIKRGAGKMTIDFTGEKSTLTITSAGKGTASGTGLPPNAGTTHTFPADGSAPTDGGFTGFTVAEGELVLKDNPATRKEQRINSTMFIGMVTKDGTADPVLTVDGAYINNHYSSYGHFWLGRNAGHNNTFMRSATLRIVNGGYFKVDTPQFGSEVEADNNPHQVTIAITNGTLHGDYTLHWSNYESKNYPVRILAKDAKIYGNLETVYLKGCVDADLDNTYVGKTATTPGRFWVQTWSVDNMTGSIALRNKSVFNINRWCNINKIIKPFTVSFDDSYYRWGGGSFTLAMETQAGTTADPTKFKLEMRGRGMIVAPGDGETLTIAWPLTGEGGFVHEGAGTVAFTNGMYKFSGVCEVASGTLDLSDAGTLDAPSFGGGGTVKGLSASKATLRLNAGDDWSADEVVTLQGASVGRVFVDFGRTAEDPLDISALPSDMLVARLSGGSQTPNFRLRGTGNRGLVGRFAVNGEGEVRMSVEPGGTIMVVR